jgi:deazaflavin-dependent oxidoreductase (nitroreductase family)
MTGTGPNLFIRSANHLVGPLIKAGLPMGSMALLTVRGRRSGTPRTTPVYLSSHGEGWSLGSPFGAVDWVKNLRAAGVAEITMRRKTLRVESHELGLEEAAPLLKASLAEAGPVARKVLGGYFDVPFDAPLTEWTIEAKRHPTFVLLPLESGARSSG